MSGAAPGGRASGWRTINAALTGLVAGVCGVVVARAVFGRGVVLAGILIGVVALIAGSSLSWVLSGSRRHVRSTARLPDGKRLRGRVHALAWFTPIVGSVVAMAAWAGVAHSSGSGWVQAVGTLLAAILIIGLLAPLLPARRVVVRCTASPSDTEAGRSVELTLVASGPIRVRPRDPVGAAVPAKGGPLGSRVVAVAVVPDHRGVVEQVVVELASCAPFGLLWWAREVEVPLPRPLHVAPRLGPPGSVDTTADDAAGQADLRVPSDIGEPRGVRPYRAGDNRRSIHWPATSHVGSLMVREKERQTDDPITVEVTLPTDPAEAELVSERVMTAVTRHLVRGQPVVLATHQADGRTVRVVRDQVDLGRRLARAVPVGRMPDRTRPTPPRGRRRGPP